MIVEVYSVPGRTTAERVLGYIRAYLLAHSGQGPTPLAIRAGLGLGLKAAEVSEALDALFMAGQIAYYWDSSTQAGFSQKRIYPADDVDEVASGETDMAGVSHDAGRKRVMHG